MEQIVESMSKQIRRVMEDQNFLTPLYTRYAKGKDTIYVIDVPYLRSETVYIKVSEKVLHFSCTDSRGYKYRLLIPLPAEFQNPDVQVSRIKGRVILRFQTSNS
ncbi:hypothetical protein [Metallosphaera tengchongensis]|nr:hypothetical protein [Metallosphaera tengchongensis]